MKQGPLTKLIFEAIHAYSAEAPVTFKVIFPNGSEGQNKDGTPDLVIHAKKWSSFLRLALLGSYGFASDYVNGRIDIDGDLRALGYLVYRSGGESNLRRAIKKGIRTDPWLVYLLDRLHMLRYLAWSRRAARYNAEYHYGLHPDFYFNYLGQTGAYSTGFWYPETKNVEESQANKWELICEKLRLQPGMKVCSVGVGFGYGEMLMAEKYGVSVDAYNACRPQVKWLREEVKRRGLEEKVKVIEGDFREVGGEEKKYDRFLAIECIEHAQDLFRAKTLQGWARALKDDGVGILQWLSYDINSDVALFIRKFLYPGVTMPPLGRLVDEVVLAGCEVQDVLCNRRHYYYTLNAWNDNFIANWEKIRAIDPKLYNEAFRRKWLLYLSSGSYYLVTPDATARLYQLTFTKGDTYAYPMNRDFLYEEQGDDSAWVLPHPWAKNQYANKQ